MSDPELDGRLVTRVAACIARTLDLPDAPSSPGTRLFGEGIGMDSIEALRLVGALEEEFDIEIDDEGLTLATFASVGSVARLVLDCTRERRA
ncbi:MAG: acyl carrier protein [Planctomycetota bacterium]|jgi:acyl carrier protein